MNLRCEIYNLQLRLEDEEEKPFREAAKKVCGERHGYLTAAGKRAIAEWSAAQLSISVHTPKSNIENSVPSAAQLNSASELHELADRAAAVLSEERVMALLRAVSSELTEENIDEKGEGAAQKRGRASTGKSNVRDSVAKVTRNVRLAVGSGKASRKVAEELRELPSRRSHGDREGHRG